MAPRGDNISVIIIGKPRSSISSLRQDNKGDYPRDDHLVYRISCMVALGEVRMPHMYGNRKALDRI
jgi:hypothetical protein